LRDFKFIRIFVRKKFNFSSIISEAEARTLSFQ
jgi:hypothetical protein